jgi:hypothetical protein
MFPTDRADRERETPSAKLERKGDQQSLSRRRTPVMFPAAPAAQD